MPYIIHTLTGKFVNFLTASKQSVVLGNHISLVLNSNILLLFNEKKWHIGRVFDRVAFFDMERTLLI